jgi:hypothetical protein
MDIDPSMPFRQCPSAVLRGNIPAPIIERLDALVTLAESAGSATNRGELIAALILAAPEASDELFDLWRQYRRELAGDATVEGLDPSRVLRYERHRPGRRSRMAG